jgi:hypothetical protein
MPMSLYFAICEFPCPEIVFSKLPWRPPDGFITSTFAMALIFSIFSVITICTCSQLCFTRLRQINITRTILRETLFSPYLVLRELSQKITLRDICQMICSILRELAWKLIQISTLEASCTRLLGLTTLPSSILTQAFASEVIPFNTDSSFWVCNNLATGHICNNKSLVSGEMVPSIYIVGEVMGTTEPTLMGMVILCTTDNNGMKHVFTLTHVNYIPNYLSIFYQLEFLANNMSMRMDLIYKAQEFGLLMILMFLFGITANILKCSRRILLAYLNVFSTQAFLV